MSWDLVFTPQAVADARRIAVAGLKPRVYELFAVLRSGPLEAHLPLDALVGEMSGVCSRPINARHRLIYQVMPYGRVVKVLRMWTEGSPDRG